MKHIQSRCPSSAPSNNREPQPITLPRHGNDASNIPLLTHFKAHQTNDYRNNPPAISTTKVYLPQPSSNDHKSSTLTFTRTSPQQPTMKRNNAIILILFLVAVFLAWFAWFLHTTCRRVVSAEVHEMLYQRDVEAQKSVGEDGKGT